MPLRAPAATSARRSSAVRVLPDAALLKQYHPQPTRAAAPTRSAIETCSNISGWRCLHGACHIPVCGGQAGPCSQPVLGSASLKLNVKPAGHAVDHHRCACWVGTSAVTCVNPHTQRWWRCCTPSDAHQVVARRIRPAAPASCKYCTAPALSQCEIRSRVCGMCCTPPRDAQHPPRPAQCILSARHDAGR